MSLRPRDLRLIDALDGLPGLQLDETVWRIAREGRDPTNCSASGGRWDDKSFDVLYASRSKDTALAEMLFHLRQGQPIVPSKLRFSLHEIDIRLENMLDLSSIQTLSRIGLDISNFGRLSYAERQGEYPRTQEIAEVAHFHGYDGLIVPSARSDGSNIVIFCDQVSPDQMEAVIDHGPVDWKLVSVS